MHTWLSAILIVLGVTLRATHPEGLLHLNLAPEFTQGVVSIVLILGALVLVRQMRNAVSLSAGGLLLASLIFSVNSIVGGLSSVLSLTPAFHVLVVVGLFALPILFAGAWLYIKGIQALAQLPLPMVYLAELALYFKSANAGSDVGAGVWWILAALALPVFLQFVTEYFQQRNSDDTILAVAARSVKATSTAEPQVQNLPTQVETHSIKAPSVLNHTLADLLGTDAAVYTQVAEKIVRLQAKLYRNTASFFFLSADSGQTYHLVAYRCMEDVEQFLNTKATLSVGTGVLGMLLSEQHMILDSKGYNLGNKEASELYLRAGMSRHIMYGMASRESDRAVQGLLLLDRKSENGFLDEDLNQLRELTQLTSELFQNIAMRLDLANDERLAKAQYHCSKDLLGRLHRTAVLNDLLVHLHSAFDPKRVLFILPDMASRQIRVEWIKGLPIPGIQVDGEGRILQSEKEQERSMSIVSFNQNFRSAYGEAFMNLKKPKIRAQVLEFSSAIPRLNPSVTDDAKYSMVGYLRLENERLDIGQEIVGMVCVESDTPFASATLEAFRSFLIMGTSALERAYLYQRREEQATMDGLTGISNHRNFQDVMDREIKLSAQSSAPVTLLLMDIDFFKKFNDTYGHQIGDLVLKKVAACLTQSVRRGVDHVARYGGEEFVVILPGQDAEQALASAERVRANIEAMIVQSEKGPLHVTVSIGVASFGEDATTKARLIERADESLYKCKGRGRNCITLCRKEHESWRGADRAEDQSPFAMAPAAGQESKEH